MDREMACFAIGHHAPRHFAGVDVVPIQQGFGVANVYEPLPVFLWRCRLKSLD
jgi:hypothetical protein